jgi:exonuclease III
MARTSFLFWNVNRKPVERHLAALAAHHDLDVLILCECEIQHAVLAAALNADSPAVFRAVDGESAFARVYSRLPSLRPFEDDDRLAAWRLARPDREEVLLAVVHLASRRYLSQDSKQQECMDLATRIRELERRVGHERTILVGDFNMNPFEPGMVGTGGLHAVMSLDVARKRKRRVQNKDHSYFYNPMWGRFGDGSPGPCGTYYYRNGEQVCYFWNMFDQVLVRPELIDRFNLDRLAVPVAAGKASLVNSHGRPDVVGASDHLPIVFELDL